MNENIEIKKASKEEYNQIIELINKVFRISRGYKPTMVKEFPLLLNKDNYNQIIIAKDANRVISTVNYMENKLNIEGTTISQSSIGGVCTDEEYRGREISSNILKKVEKDMKNKNISVCTISGNRSLYTRWGACEVNSFYKYYLKSSKNDKEIEFRDICEKDIDYMIKIYNNESIRYIRSKNQFINLLSGATIPWGDYSYIRKMIIYKEKVIGYLILRKIAGSLDGEIVEINCPQDLISRTLRKISYAEGLNGINYFVGINDLKNNLIEYDKRVIDLQHGTVKIIEFNNLMKELNSYFKQYLTDVELKEFSYGNTNKYYFKYRGEKLEIDSLTTVTKIIFDFFELEKNIYNEKSSLIKLLKKIFPVQLPYTKNLNYQ